MPSVFIESFAEFSERHGGSPIEARNRLLWPDGAQASLDENNYPRIEPPSDEFQRLQLQREYRLLRVRQAEAEFAAAKSELSELAANAKKYRNLPSPVNGPEILRGLAAEVQAFREELAKVETQISQTPYGLQHRAVEEAESQRKSEVARLHAELMGIRI